MLVDQRAQKALDKSARFVRLTPAVTMDSAKYPAQIERLVGFLLATALNETRNVFDYKLKQQNSAKILPPPDFSAK